MLQKLNTISEKFWILAKLENIKSYISYNINRKLPKYNFQTNIPVYNTQTKLPENNIKTKLPNYKSYQNKTKLFQEYKVATTKKFYSWNLRIQ